VRQFEGFTGGNGRGRRHGSDPVLGQYSAGSAVPAVWAVCASGLPLPPNATSSISHPAVFLPWPDGVCSAPVLLDFPGRLHLRNPTAEPATLVQLQ
jgi:hypothetical protein